MTCSICGGLVTWVGPLTSLTHTECQNCGAVNSQVDEEADEEAENERYK
jgi:hypothetical protein